MFRQLFLDVDVLQQSGVTDLSSYAVNPANELVTDFFVDRKGAQLSIAK